MWNRHMNKLAVALGIVILAIAMGAAPMPLTLTLSDPARNVSIYPNVLFAVPLMLLGVLLLLYGITVGTTQDGNVK
jgi:peptidoglycan/LPS O-acetylase OafA/YrhL